jgi:Tfp pilus assembly protein PilO
MNWLQENKSQLLILISIIIIVGIAYFLDFGSYQNFKTLQASQAASQTELVLAQTKIKALETQSKDIDSLNNAKNTVNQLLPNDIDATIFASMIEKLGQNVGVTPLSVSITQATAATKKEVGAASSTGFTLSFTTGYQKVLETIAQMEKLDRLNTITNLILAPQESGIAVNLSGKIYNMANNK